MGTLQNKTIVITRRAEQAKGLIRSIEERGGKPLLFPTITTRPTEKTERRDRVLSALNTYQWIVFGSANAVKYFLAQMSEEALKGALPKIAAVGSQTAKTLQKAGLYVDVIPAEYTAKGLLDVFSRLGVEHQRFLLPVSDIARKELPDGLLKLGAKVDAVEFYRTVPNPDFDKERFLRLLQSDSPDVLTFFSPSAFRYLKQLAGAGVTDLIKKSRAAVAAIGPVTAKALTDEGLTVDIQPRVSDTNHLVEAMEGFFERGG